MKYTLYGVQSHLFLNLRFESSVIRYGTQAVGLYINGEVWFESSVIRYGTQAIVEIIFPLPQFESSVIRYGTQAETAFIIFVLRLRAVL